MIDKFRHGKWMIDDEGASVTMYNNLNELISRNLDKKLSDIKVKFYKQVGYERLRYEGTYELTSFFSKPDGIYMDVDDIFNYKDLSNKSYNEKMADIILNISPLMEYKAIDKVSQIRSIGNLMLAISWLAEDLGIKLSDAIGFVVSFDEDEDKQ